MHEDITIQQLWDFGHFFSPEALVIDLVDEDSLSKLTAKDSVVQAAVRSYQKWFKDDLDFLCLRAPEFRGHYRLSVADGEIGSATVDLLKMPRCRCPDYRHPMRAALEGNWPDQCRMEITTSFRMQLQGLGQSDIARLWVEADKNWERSLEVGFSFQPSDYPNTRFYAQAEAMRGSVLAWHQLATNNCSARLPGAYNSNVNWSAALLVTTITHEHGHGLGFNHVRDSQATMYPSITSASQSRRGKPSSADIREAVARGYKERRGPIPDDPDEPDNPSPNEHRLYLASKSPIRIIPE